MCYVRALYEWIKYDGRKCFKISKLSVTHVHSTQLHYLNSRQMIDLDV